MRVTWAANLKKDFMSIKKFEFIAVENKELFWLVEINRPDKLNALNEGVLQELKQLLLELLELPLSQGPKAIVLTGAGEKAFVAGADISAMLGMSLEKARAFGSLGQEVTLLMEKLPRPVIAAVNGFALGGGCELAMSCDFIYALHSATFGQPEVKLGLIPGYGGTQRLAKYIGRNRAKELIYTGKNLSAEMASDWGLVNALFETKEQMIKACEETIKQLSKNSLLAIAESKAVMNAGNDLPISQGLKLELDAFAGIFSSFDANEGTKAFIEKRRAEFKGQ